MTVNSVWTAGNHLHVFDSSTEGVGDRPVMDGLLAQTEVRQLHVPCTEVEVRSEVRRTKWVVLDVVVVCL